jgi:hypothetical protein
MAHSIKPLDICHVLVNDQILPAVRALAVLWAPAATWSGRKRHESLTFREQGYTVLYRMQFEV